MAEGIVRDMEGELGQPDLHLSLPLDPYAPSEARHAVGRIDKPSPDLRDAVVLLTSELVTRMLRQRGIEATGVELRVWMPREIVRVEVSADSLVVPNPAGNGDPEYDLMLLEQTTDRWAIERSDGRICAWFEIDRRRPAPTASDGQRPVQHTAV
jgi:hypothetical protein